VNVCCVCLGDISAEINAEDDGEDVTEGQCDDTPSTGMFAVCGLEQWLK